MEDISIRLSDDQIEKMYNKFCNSVDECINCCCSVDIGEIYNTCEDKYIDRLLAQDVRDLVNNTIDSMVII